MGVGGDGCVVFPAILFPNSRIVNRGTRQQYITKLATSLKKEYEVGRYIASKAPDTGIFPVDDFVEDVAIEDLGPKKYKIIEDCQESRFSEAFRKQGAEFVRRRYVSLTAIQYPKFVNTLDHLRDHSPALFKGCYEDLRLKLMELHRHNIFHLDVKLPNIGYFRHGDFIDPKFADWGLSFIFDNDVEKTKDEFFTTLSPSFRFYYYGFLIGRAELFQIYRKHFPHLFSINGRPLYYDILTAQFFKDEIFHDSKEEFEDIENRLGLTFHYNTDRLLAYFTDLDNYALIKCFK
jgi:hypothetical protein